jgi:DNA adenine methylase
LNTPIAYYGGKQQMLRHILPLIPAHELYTEAFFGGGALLFAKTPAKCEVINDLNDFVVNFYQVLQDDFEGLVKLVNRTLHSRSLYRQAKEVYARPSSFSPTMKAWAFWILTQQGFANHIGSWGYNKKNSLAKKLLNAKRLFNEELKERVELLQIECNDAVQVIKSRDYEGAFHYVDPPYFNSNCGHYGGYTRDDFERLLSQLSQCKGKFLLSSYPSDILAEFTARYGWHTETIIKTKGVSANVTGSKNEVLTANYPISTK